MESWIITFIIFAIVICIVAVVYVSIEFIFDVSDRRRERSAWKNTVKHAENKSTETDYTITSNNNIKKNQ